MPGQNPRAMPTIDITRLFGHTLDLVCDTLIERYHFNATGHVAATMGVKDGPVTAPLFSYRMLSHDSLEILHGSGHTERWTGMRIEGDLLHVERDGRPRTFTITKPTP